MSPYVNTRRTPLSINLQPPRDSSTQWRCPHKRLHLDSQDCFPISPDSPIIDTPSKYRKMQARRNAALLLNDSQATQPTPSGPQQAGKHHHTPEESSAHSPQHHGDKFGNSKARTSTRAKTSWSLPARLATTAPSAFQKRPLPTCHLHRRCLS